MSVSDAPLRKLERLYPSGRCQQNLHDPFITITGSRACPEGTKWGSSQLRVVLGKVTILPTVVLTGSLSCEALYFDSLPLAVQRVGILSL